MGDRAVSVWWLAACGLLVGCLGSHGLPDEPADAGLVVDGGAPLVDGESGPILHLNYHWIGSSVLYWSDVAFFEDGRVVFSRPEDPRICRRTLTEPERREWLTLTRRLRSLRDTPLRRCALHGQWLAVTVDTDGRRHRATTCGRPLESGRSGRAFAAMTGLWEDLDGSVCEVPSGPANVWLSWAEHDFARPWYADLDVSRQTRPFRLVTDTTDHDDPVECALPPDEETERLVRLLAAPFDRVRWRPIELWETREPPEPLFHHVLGSLWVADTRSDVHASARQPSWLVPEPPYEAARAMADLVERHCPTP